MTRQKVRPHPRNFKRCTAVRPLIKGVGVLLATHMASGCGVPAPTAQSLTAVHETPLPASRGERMLDLRLRTEDGDTVRAVLRWPEGSAHLGGVILVAGRETGREAAALIPGPLEAAVLAVEYPEAIPDRLEARAVRDLGRLRTAARRMPSILLGATDHLLERAPVDPDRVLMVGVSFGVPFAAAAGRDERYAAVALLHGGADLALLLRENLEGPRLQRTVLARIGAWALRSLEPARHVPHIAPRPLLLVNGLHDELVPRRSAELLRRHADGPVRQIWLPHGHLMPGDHAKTRELADTTARTFPEIVYGTEEARPR